MIEKNLKDFKTYLQQLKYSNSTINSYIISVRDFLNYLSSTKINIECINNNILKAYIVLISSNSAQTINSKVYAIKKFIDFINIKNNLNIILQHAHVKPEKKKSINFFDEFNNIIDIIQEKNQNNQLIRDRDTLIFYFLYFLGIKISEVVKIKKSDIIDNTIQIDHKKIVINNEIKIFINKYFDKIKISENQYLLFSAASKKVDFNNHLTTKSIENIFNKYTSFISKSYTIRDLRSSYNLKNMNLKIQIINTNKHVNKYLLENFLNYYLEN